MYLKPHLGPMRANTVLGEAVTPIWGEETFGVLWFAVTLFLSMLRIMKLSYFLFHFIMVSA